MTRWARRRACSTPELAAPGGRPGLEPGSCAENVVPLAFTIEVVGVGGKGEEKVAATRGVREVIFPDVLPQAFVAEEGDCDEGGKTVVLYPFELAPRRVGRPGLEPGTPSFVVM